MGDRSRSVVEFLQQLWSGGSGFGLFCAQSRTHVGSWSPNHVVPVPGAFTLPVNYDKKICYFAPALFNSAVRKKSTVAAVRTFWCDVDFHDEPNTRSKLDAKIDVVSDKLITYGLPPTWLVRTGRGVHFYWVTTDVFAADEWTAIAQKLNLWLRSLHIGHDEQVTTDVTRWLRLPASVNPKCVPEYIVKLESVSTDLWSRESILAATAEAAISMPIGMAKAAKIRQLATLDELASACPMIGEELKTHGATSREPLWRTMLAAALFTDAPERNAHELSYDHPEYDLTATLAKLETIRGQQEKNGFGFPTCQMFRRVGPKDRCSTCPGRILVEEEEKEVSSTNALTGGLGRHTPIDQVRLLRLQIDASLARIEPVAAGSIQSSEGSSEPSEVRTSADLIVGPTPFTIRFYGSEEPVEIPGAFVTTNGIVVTSAIDERARLEFLNRMKNPRSARSYGLSFSSLRDVTAGLFLPARLATTVELKSDDVDLEVRDSAGYLRVEGTYNDQPKVFDVPILALQDARKTMKVLASQHVVVTQDRHLGVQHLLTRIVEQAQKAQQRRFYAERMGAIEVPVEIGAKGSITKIRGFCYGTFVALHGGDKQQIPPNCKIEIATPTTVGPASAVDLIERGDRETSIQLIRDYLSVDQRPQLHAYFATILGGLIYHIAMPIASMPLFHLWGGTGVGKTTATTIGASMLARPDRVNPTSNRTLGFTVELCSAFREIPTFYEEAVAIVTTAQRKGNAQLFVDDLFYLMSGGARGRLNRGNEISEVCTWRTILLTSSNLPMTDALMFLPHEAGVARVLELELPKLTNDQMATMEAQVHSCATQAQFHCGWIGPELIKHVYANYDETYSSIQNHLRVLHDKLNNPSSRSQGRFVAAVSASALEAAKLGIELFGLPFDLNGIEQVLLRAMLHTLDVTKEVLEEDTLLKLVQRFVKNYSYHQVHYKIVKNIPTVVKVPANGRAPFIEWNLTDNIMYIDYNEFDTFLQVKREPPLSRLLDAHVNKYGVDNGVTVCRYAIGAQCGVAVPGYQKAVQLDFNHPVFRDDVPSMDQVQVARPTPSMLRSLDKFH